MSNIIPQYINDRFNTLNEYIKNLYRAFVEFSKNFAVDASGNINLNSANNVNIDASGNINITGTIVGNPLNLNSPDDINLDTSGNINITGTIVGNPLNLNSTSAINISGTSINLVSSAANEIYVNNSSGSNLMKFKFGSGVPSGTASTGSLYVDYTNGFLYIYRIDMWKLM